MYLSESRTEILTHFFLCLVPYVFSISYQDFENTVTPEYATRVSVEFMKGNARGLTFVTGSGDWGVGCTNSPDAELQVNCNIFTADFPSSSPYLTSLGTSFEIFLLFVARHC
jgi:tripeptidyl-peptidase-1